MKLKVGDKIKLVKPMGVFDNVGEICEVIDIKKPAETGDSSSNKTTISFKFGNGAHLGVMSEDECDAYFKRAESAVFTEDDAIKMINKSDIVVHQVFNKRLIVAAMLPCGYVMVESSGSMSPQDFSRSAAYAQCLGRIRKRILQAETYRLMQEGYIDEQGK